MTSASTEEHETASDFIREMVAEDLRTGKYGGRVVTRFPPEPNGYLHIGHAKSICLNFGIAEEFGGQCNLRFDDTNPTTEDPEFVAAIQHDVRWLGFDWENRLYHASDYFQQLYDYAVRLIEDGKAYVDSLSEEEIRAYRGTINEPGRNSPHRERSVAENLALFARMRAGELPEGSHVLRAKIDMAATNMKMRDPLLYRIRHAAHYRTGDAWHIYPMYDFAHCLSDAIECVTHSLCTLEFENNRAIYDWVLDNLPVSCRPEQTEFARLNLSYTVLSKRKLIELVEEGHVAGWDDPRLPTLSGLRRRGFTPASIRTFAAQVGVTKNHNVADMALLEHTIRDDLNPQVSRVLAVLRPLEVVIENYPEDEGETFDAPSYPRDVPKEGSRPLPFSRRLYIEHDDFREAPPKGFYRLAPGREVRLRYAYIIKCVGVDRDEATNEVVRLRCTYDPESRGGNAPDGRKIKGTIHWVSAAHALPIEARLYDRLFTCAAPGADKDTDFKDSLNPDSLEVLGKSLVEPSVGEAAPGSRFQFERQGYFYLDPADTDPIGTPNRRLACNRIVTLRDTWAKIEAAATGETLQEARAAARRAKQARQAPQPPAEPKAPQAEQPLSPEQEARRRRYADTLGLGGDDARLLAAEDDLAALFEEACATHDNPQGIANWIVNELLAVLKERTVADLPFGGEAIGELVALIDDGTLSGTAAKKVFATLLEKGGSPQRIVATEGLEQLSDIHSLEPIVERVLAAEAENVAAYRAGKTTLLGYFVGQVMQQTRGRANPQMVKELLAEKLTVP